MFKGCKEKTLQRAIIILETMKTDSTLCQQNLLKIQPFSHITEPIEFVNRFSFK